MTPALRRMRRAVLACLGGLAAMALTFAPPAPASASPEAAPAGSAQVAWDPSWAKFRTGQYFLLPVLGGGTLTAALSMPGSPRWRGDGALDRGARSVLRIRDQTARRIAARIGDVLYVGLTAAPAALDSFVLAQLVHESEEVAWQTFMIYGQSMLTTAFATVLAQGASGRIRPMVDECARDLDYDPMCKSRWLYRSFFAGHVSMAFTGASLLCVTHTRIPLLGGGAESALACALPFAAATYVGVSRVSGDKHWLSDVLVGAAIGAASGLLIPLALHYGFGAPEAPEDAPPASIPRTPIGLGGTF